MSNIYDWFQERLEIQAIADDITSKYVPPHVNIFYCFGGITLTCFIIQVATGFAMTFLSALSDLQTVVVHKSHAKPSVSGHRRKLLKLISISGLLL